MRNLQVGCLQGLVAHSFALLLMFFVSFCQRLLSSIRLSLTLAFVARLTGSRTSCLPGFTLSRDIVSNECVCESRKAGYVWKEDMREKKKIKRAIRLDMPPMHASHVFHSLQKKRKNSRSLARFKKIERCIMHGSKKLSRAACTAQILPAVQRCTGQFETNGEPWDLSQILQMLLKCLTVCD